MYMDWSILSVLFLLILADITWLFTVRARTLVGRALQEEISVQAFQG